MVQKLFRLARKNLALVSILAAGLAGRIIAAPFLNKISGGDFFNFLLITKELVNFSNPFIAKRLPFYPLLLVPGHILGHPIGWAKILGVFCSLGILVVLYLLGRQLKIKKEILYLTLVFAAFQPTLFIYSLRPLTHTLFTFEVLLSLYLFYRLFSFDRSRSSIRKFLLFGLVLGLMSMTRHEGFVVAAVLLICFVLFLVARRHPEECGDEGSPNLFGSLLAFARDSSPSLTLGVRMTIRSISLVVLPLLVIVTPYFVSNYLRFGNFLYSGYAADPGLNRVNNLQGLLVNFEKVKWIILNLWGSTGYFPIKWVLIPSVLVLLATCILRSRVWITFEQIVVAKRRLCSNARFCERSEQVLIGLLIYWIIIYLLGPFEGALPLLSFFFACAMFLGGLKFIIDTRWQSVPFLLVLITQTILLLFIQPWARHLQHTFPFWALFLGIGLNWIFEGGRDKPCNYNNLAVVVLSGVILFNSFGGIKTGIANHQRGVLPAQPLFEAVNFTKDLEGPIAFESNASWVQYYLGEKAVYFAQNLEIPPVDRSFEKSLEEQWAWIQDTRPKYLVHYSLWDAFSLVETEKFGSHFQLIKLFESVRGSENFTTEIYRVLPNR